MWKRETERGNGGKKEREGVKEIEKARYEQWKTSRGHRTDT